MSRGKNTCKILKEIRKQIAEDNDIELITSECTYQGDCEGTCPKCESEVRYLERELEKRQRMGKAAVIAGMSIGTLFAATGCSQAVQPVSPDNTEIPERPLAGDVVADPPVKPADMVDPRDTIFPPLMGIVPLFHSMIHFDSDQYQNLMKDKFEYPGMKNLTVVDGEIEYQMVADKGGGCETVEELVAATNYFKSPYYIGGEDKMLDFIASELGDILKKGKYSGVMEVKFYVSEQGGLRDVEIVKGFDATLNEAMVAIFKRMDWNPAIYELKNDERTSSFACHCIQKIHFPIKK